jgi:hypothetical protein
MPDQEKLTLKLLVLTLPLQRFRASFRHSREPDFQTVNPLPNELLGKQVWYDNRREKLQPNGNSATVDRLGKIIAKTAPTPGNIHS